MPTATKKLAYYYKDGQYYEVTADIPAITVDTALSTTSENPVQNKVVTAAVNSLQDDIDDVDAKANTVVIGGTQYTATFVDGVLSFTAV